MPEPSVDRRSRACFNAQTLLPVPAMLTLGSGALVVHAAVVVVSPPEGADWITAGVVFAFPIGILRLACNHRRARS